MTRLGILIIFFCWTLKSTSQQNLVSNYSFEEYINCPVNVNSNSNDTFNVAVWNAVLFNPDYYNECGNGMGNINTAFGGGGMAKDGVAYIGLIVWVRLFLGREIVETSLTDSLKSNQKYNCSFWVMKPDSFRHVTKNIGLYFSKNKVLFNKPEQYYTALIPQVKYTGSDFLSRDGKWLNIKGSFIAQGGESHIAIGNFDEDFETQLFLIDSSVVNSWWYETAYYYIDNISVVEDTSYHPIGIEEEQLERLKLTYHGGNLHLQGLLFQNRETELFLYSYDGKQVGSYTLPKGNNSIPLKLHQGIYLYSLNIGEQVLKRGKIWVGGE